MLTLEKLSLSTDEFLDYIEKTVNEENKFKLDIEVCQLNKKILTKDTVFIQISPLNVVTLQVKSGLSSK